MTAPQDSSFHIAFCVDNHYFRSMGATIASVIANNPDKDFTFHVLAFSISDDHRKRLAEFERNTRIRIVPHVIDKGLFSEFSGMIGSSYLSLSTFSRLVIPSLLQPFTDRVLYLDADMLCVGRLDDLMSMDISDTIALVVSDVGWKSGEGRDGRYSVLNLKHPEYFNAGVIYINIPQWEENSISQHCVRTLLEEGKRLAFNDQDALNIVLDGRTRYIDKKWNYIYSMIADLKRGQLRMASVGDAVLIHFAGAIKPWNDWSGHDARALFAEYHAQSPWRDLPLDQAPLNYKEMRICSRSLIKRGRYLQGLRWYLKYLRASVKRKSGN